MQHLDEGTIHAWLDGALAEDEAARVERHAAECATCAAAVAEARGLIAGSSRILSALDHVPGGVIPASRDASSGSARPARSARSRWRMLRMTPVRAAAAAVLFVAAGTVLVLRQAPNVAPAPESEAGPDALDPGRAARVSPAAPRVVLPEAAPPSIARDTAVVKMSVPARRLERAAAAPPRVPAAEAPRRPAAALAMDSVSAQKVAAAAAPAPTMSNATEAAAPAIAGARAMPRARAAGGIAGSVAERRADALMSVTQQQPSVTALAGCYAVQADTTAGLPRRIVLDSTRAADVSGVPTFALRIPAESRQVDSTARQGFWQPAANGGLRLYLEGSAAVPLDLRPISPIAFAGTRAIDNRQVSIVLQRLTDCPVR